MKPLTKRRYLRELVEAKSRAFPPLTEEERAFGFLGWHERGYLPHCDYPGLVQFVTFRLADSMPSSRCGEWEHLLSIEADREKRIKLEEYLDTGVGECLLRDVRVAKVAEHALLHFHLDRYELLSWSIMPNHVHVLVHIWQTPLAKLLQSWKSFVAGETNQILQRTGQMWEPEYWDTFMRDEKQEKTAIRYIENNPVKAKLCQVPEEWTFSSARFRDEYCRLALPSTGGAGAPRSANVKASHELVADKNCWSHPLSDEERTLGFLGWHERGYLPHCDFSDLVQFVTLRLVDSLPACRPAATLSPDCLPTLWICLPAVQPPLLSARRPTP